MRAFTSSLTIVAVLLHVLLGCHAHHGHACELPVDSVMAHACGHAPQPHNEAPSPHEEPCDESECAFSHSNTETVSVGVAGSAWTAPTIGSQNLGSDGSNLNCRVNFACLPPACGKYVLYCVLRN